VPLHPRLPPSQFLDRWKEMDGGGISRSLTCSWIVLIHALVPSRNLVIPISAFCIFDPTTVTLTGQYDSRLT
jgi:hypothetical protein